MRPTRATDGRVYDRRRRRLIIISAGAAELIAAIRIAIQALALRRHVFVIDNEPAPGRRIFLVLARPIARRLVICDAEMVVEGCIVVVVAANEVE